MKIKIKSEPRKHSFFMRLKVREAGQRVAGNSIENCAMWVTRKIANAN